MTTSELPITPMTDDVKVQTMFPSSKVDFTKMKTNYDEYVPTSQTVFDTNGLDRIDIHIPHKNVILKDFAVWADIA